MGDVPKCDDNKTQKSDANPTLWSDMSHYLSGLADTLTRAGGKCFPEKSPIDPKLLPELVIGAAAGAAAGHVGGITARMAVEAAKTAHAVAPAQVHEGISKVGSLIKEAVSNPLDAMLMPAPKVNDQGLKARETESKIISQITSEIKSTPSDVVNHFKERPVSAAVEMLVFPPLVIVDAKLRR